MGKPFIPIILVVDVGKFEVPEYAMSELRSFAEKAHRSLREGSQTRLQEDYGALFTALLRKGTRISLVDPRPVDFIIPSPTADYELLHRLFMGVG
jgi:hypothetical protein